MAELYESTMLDKDSPTEVAFWEAHREELSRQYPGKYLIIRGEEVCRVLNDSAEFRVAEQGELAERPALVRFVFDQEPAFSPFSEEFISA